MTLPLFMITCTGCGDPVACLSPDDQNPTCTDCDKKAAFDDIMAPKRTNAPDAIEYAQALAHLMVPLMHRHAAALSGMEWPTGGGDHLQANLDLGFLAGDAGLTAFRIFVDEFNLVYPGETTAPEWNIVDTAMDYLVSAVVNQFCFEEVDYDQDLELRLPWKSVVTESVFMKPPVEGQEYDEGGLPVHLPMGITIDGEGPCDEDAEDYSRTVCWCHTPQCTKHITEGAA
jgi:hypothetical protein